VSKRDDAIESLMELVDPDHTQVLTRAKATQVVDTLIEAAREPLSDYARQVDQLMENRIKDGAP